MPLACRPLRFAQKPGTADRISVHHGEGAMDIKKKVILRLKLLVSAKAALVPPRMKERAFRRHDRLKRQQLYRPAGGRHAMHCSVARQHVDSLLNPNATMSKCEVRDETRT